jgi:hypothetical protein
MPGLMFATLTGFHTGAYVSLNLSDMFHITAELLCLEPGPLFSFLTKAEKEEHGDMVNHLKTTMLGCMLPGAKCAYSLFFRSWRAENFPTSRATIMAI